ncbi:MAG: hypothetical protein FJ100_12940 [Deltaproteobacteria bacterium]|nr:hypothetical protein [Deltaproteobacteria bacterium]
MHMRWVTATNLVGLLAALGLVGCGEDPKPAGKDAAADSAAELSGDTGQADAASVDAAPEAAPEDSSTDVGDPLDTPADTDAEADAAVEDAPDAQPADVAQCSTAADCAGKVALSPCQDALCDLGTCKAIPKPFPTCCTNAACDDKDECTTDTCDTSSHQCKNAVDPLCCSGKKTLLKSGFEAVVFDGLKSSDLPTNGNVQWQVSTARAHSGKSSLYFGNGCKTYDTSMTPDTGCKPGKDAQPVGTTLASAAQFLPDGKKAHLAFWLWLDSEAPYAKQFKPATCKTPCPAGANCFQVNDVAQCLVEKDVLSVSVVEAGKATQVWTSLAIGKSTKGLWQLIAVDLSDWSGKTVKVQWNFASGSAFKNDHEGIYLDDMVWETVCAQAYCDAANPCKADEDVCTADGCHPYVNGAAGSGAGACLYAKAAGCCTADSDCNDAVACTLDVCKAGQCTNSPDPAKPGCCKSAVSFYAPFDDALTEWTTLQQNSATVGWHLLPNGGEAGGALGFSNEDGTSYHDPVLNDDIGPKGLVCSKPVQLKSGTLFNLLTFQLKLDTEWTGGAPGKYINPPLPGLPKFDEFTVQAMVAGQPTVVWSSDMIAGTTNGKWKTITVPLDAMQGKSVQVCLGFDAGDGSKNEFSGAAVDELAVKVACSKQLCYLDGECAAKACGSCEAPKCDAQTGCTCAKTPGCCAGDGDCDDKDDCTTDQCAGKVCKNTKKPDCPPPPAP